MRSLCYNNQTVNAALTYLEQQTNAGMMELADVPDSKSGGSDTVRVRPPLPAPKNRLHAKSVFPFVMRNIGGWDFREHIKRMTFIKVYLHVS